jgi:hypothetical protein
MVNGKKWQTPFWNLLKNWICFDFLPLNLNEKLTNMQGCFTTLQFFFNISIAVCAFQFDPKFKRLNKIKALD